MEVFAVFVVCAFMIVNVMVFKSIAFCYWSSERWSEELCRATFFMAIVDVLYIVLVAGVNFLILR